MNIPIPKRQERRRYRAHHFATTSGTGQQQQPPQAYHEERQSSTGCPVCHRPLFLPLAILSASHQLAHFRCLGSLGGEAA